MRVDRVPPVVRKCPKIQNKHNPTIATNMEGKRPNKFTIWKQTNGRENNNYESERGQVLHGSAMCLRPQAFKLAKASPNKSNEFSKELQRRIFHKNPLSKASQNPKYKFSPNPNWSHNKSPLWIKGIKDSTKVSPKGVPKELQSFSKYPRVTKSPLEGSQRI